LLRRKMLPKRQLRISSRRAASKWSLVIPLKLVVSNNAECLSKSIPWSINKGENLLQHTNSDNDAVDFVFRSFYIYVLSLAGNGLHFDDARITCHLFTIYFL
jgi:hypothetical protein